MIPFANDVVTLYHKGADGYAAHLIPGCSLRQTARRSATDRAQAYTAETVCRIPPGGVKPAPGDVIVPGACGEIAENEIGLMRLLDSLRPDGAFRVNSVSDNTGAPLPHYAARGE